MRKFIGALFLAMLGFPSFGQNQSVYSEGLENGWENWSWATVNFTATAAPHAGSFCIGVTGAAYQGLYLHHASFNSGPFETVVFWIRGGGAGGQRLQIQAHLNGVAQTAAVQVRPATTWQEVTVTLASLGVANRSNLDGFWIQDNSGGAHEYYVDDFRLVAGVTTNQTGGAVTLLVDAAGNRRRIDARIYGLAFASQAELADLNAPLNRSGGNTESRYNWQVNAHNRGFDWYFQSIGDATGSTPGGETDAFINRTRAAGAEAMVTASLMNWAPKLGPGRNKLASFSIAKYGPQTGNDSQYFSDAGNGIRTNSPRVYVTGNDPNDANLPVTTAFQMDWVRHLTNRWGMSASGGVRYYILDNEPSLWHSTHRDVHPAGQTMVELRDKYFDFAPKIKDLDPGALIVGPEEWGWSGYFYSGADQQAGPSNNWARFPDREANGNKDFMPWFLEQMRLQSQAAGRRLLDVFTLHYYPQGGEYSDDASSAMQARRAQSTRSLWDTNYVDATWINDRVKLVPRMREWVNANYPGTQIGLTEYSWGADGHISGATAQADVLGILGREGMDLATRWTTPSASSPTYKAIKLYRNYDGNKSTFGETSVKAVAPDVDKVAVFAAERADGALTVMAINKQMGVDAPALLTLTNFAAGTAQRWQLTAANAITRLADQSSTNGIFSNTLPAQSMTLFVLASAAARITAVTNDVSLVRFTISGLAGRRYAIESATALGGSWSRALTNTAPGTNFGMTLPIPSGTRFYRAAQLD